MQLPRHLFLLIAILCASSCIPVKPSAEPSADEQPEQTATDDDVAPSDDANPDWTAEYDAMAAALELSAEEVAALQDAFRRREEVVGGWLAQNGARLRELEQEMKSAARRRDLSTVQRVKAEATPLRTQLRDLIASHQADIHATLTPDNRLQWDAHQLAERLLELMETLELTPEQIDQIRDAALTAAQAKANEPNPAAAGYLHLEKSVEAGVLTPAQQGRFNQIKQKKPLRSLY